SSDMCSPISPDSGGKMRVSVIGCGYLGAVHAACMAGFGHQVVGVDSDPEKAARLARGRTTCYEPGLPELLDEQLGSGRLTFTSDPAAVAGSVVHFLCVGTPQRDDGDGADLSHLDSAVGSLLPHLRGGDVVVGKSTVPVGTAARLARQVEDRGAVLVWNPEFLRESQAIQDTVTPDRIVYGLSAGDAGERAKAVLDEVYAEPLRNGTPLVETDYASAELTKVAANSFLATMISFINAMAEVCEASGAD